MDALYAVQQIVVPFTTLNRSSVVIVDVCIVAVDDSKMYRNASDHTITSNLGRTSDSPRYQVGLNQSISQSSINF